MSTLLSYKELNMVIFLNHIYLNKNKPTHSPPYCCPGQCNSSLTTWLMEDTQNHSSTPPWHIKPTKKKHPTSASSGGKTPGGYFYSACGRIWLVRRVGVCSWRRDITAAPRVPWVGTGSWQASTHHPQRGSMRLAHWLLTTSDGALTPRTQN